MSVISVITLAFVLALIPTLINALLIWWLDRYEKEPLRMLLVAFLWGAVPAIGLAIVVELVADVPLQMFVQEEGARQMASIGLVAPVVEEAIKAIILVILFLVSWREFDNVLDGVVYGAMVGLGFAFVENVIYLFSSAYENVPEGGPPDLAALVQIWLLRSLLFGLNHSMFTAFTGAALGLARSLKSLWQVITISFLGLASAMTLHSIHNSLVISIGTLAGDESDTGYVLGACLSVLASDWGGLLFILAVAIGSSVREGHVIRETLLEEVALGRLAPDEYATLISGRRRWSARWSALTSSGFKRWRHLGKFFDLATELAFRKHRMHDGSPRYQATLVSDVARLRGEIDQMRNA
jgi:protease PrsW